MTEHRLRLAGEAPDPPPGPALLAMGFRPFFLAAAAFAALTVPLWVLALRGALPARGGGLQGVAWHVHELTLGYAGAVLAGFLLTAVRMWAGGRETVTGRPLLALVALWVAGRVAHLPGMPGGPASALPDLAFLFGVTVAIGRPLLAAKSRRNYGFLVALPAFALAGAALHVAPGATPRIVTLLVDMPILAIAVVGARITPLFTRNVVLDPRIGALPAVEPLILPAMAAVLLADLWPAGPSARGAIGLAAGALLLLRMARWGTARVFGQPLLLVLHAGYAALGVGLLLRGAPLLGWPISPAASTHLLAVGSLGVVSLGMLARVALGHTGRPLVADAATVAAFASLGIATVLRVGVALCEGIPAVQASKPTLLAASAAAWSLAFLLFLARFAPILAARRPDGRAG